MSLGSPPRVIRKAVISGEKKPLATPATTTSAMFELVVRPRQAMMATAVRKVRIAVGRATAGVGVAWKFDHSLRIEAEGLLSFGTA
jgi:hypothetical protein